MADNAIRELMLKRAVSKGSFIGVNPLEASIGVGSDEYGKKPFGMEPRGQYPGYEDYSTEGTAAIRAYNAAVNQIVRTKAPYTNAQIHQIASAAAKRAYDDAAAVRYGSTQRMQGYEE